MELNLTLEQRLILLNQYKILKKIYPEEALQYSIYQEIVSNGYTLHYNDLLENMNEPMSKEEMEFVLDILDVYNSLSFAVDKRQEYPSYKNKKIVFPGFDGNNEYKYIEYMQFYIYKLNRFEALKKDSSLDYNTHGETIDIYKHMIDVWKSFGNERFNLSDEALQSLIKISYPNSFL